MIYTLLAIYLYVSLEVFEWATEKCVDKGGVNKVYLHEIKNKFIAVCNNKEAFVYEQ